MTDHARDRAQLLPSDLHQEDTGKGCRLIRCLAVIYDPQVLCRSNDIEVQSRESKGAAEPRATQPAREGRKVR